MQQANNIIIRQERTEDQQAIFDVHCKAFGRPYEADLVDRLRKGSAYIPELSLVAVLGVEVVGHILFTKLTIVNESSSVESLALAPVSVLPQYQRSGIGGKLINKGLEVATHLGYSSVIVLGHAAYYPKFGFVPAATWNIRAPFDVPASVFMAKELRPGALEGVSGVVAYAPEFSEVDEPDTI